MVEKDDSTRVKIVSMPGSNGHESLLYHATPLERPQSSSVSLPGNNDLLAECNALVTQSQVELADLLTVGKVQRLLNQVGGYEGNAQQAIINTFRVLIGHLPTDARQQLNLYSLFNPPDQPKQIERFLTSCPAPVGAPIFKPMCYVDLLAQPPKQWLVDHVFGAGDIGMIFGPPGSGKSFIVIDMIVAACLGKQWAKSFDISRALSVAYCAGEGFSGLPQRLYAAAQHHGVKDVPNISFFNIPPQLFAPEREGSNAKSETMANFVRDWQQHQQNGQVGTLDVLIIDTLHSAIVGADENSAQDMSRVLMAVKDASKALGCAVILVHHSNKAGTGERGSSAMRGAMDFMIEVKPTVGKFAMECAKLKDAPAWKAQTFDLIELGDSARVWWDEPNEIPNSTGKHSMALLATLQQRPSSKFTAKQLCEVVGAGQSATINALTRLVDKGQVRRSLLDEGKQASSRNPWVYSLILPE